ncbi:hypothetical protein HF1_08780 [Mycoplasma haemofelis str. Langford 1]|uniref:Uncharacterized protein n=1 Tax=Mycoplasma haemofelis (strain Langford 1) TaxID=941640 RepID=E8ZIB5_MYCHL|nr:hypothetical protein [Mycoplasma haemofelis]CBY92886.1 hypothetical protein HF1_08780 [Mycoplasma haemofelis str. Langford 1]
MINYVVSLGPVLAGATAVSVYLLWPSGASVANQIQSSISGKDYLQLVESRDSGYWTKFKELYKNFKGEKLDGVTEETLPDWCEKNLSIKASDKSEKELEFARQWCVVDVRSVKAAAKGLGKTPVSEISSGEQTTAWQTAWEYYKNNKGSKNLDIVDGDVKTEETQGKEAGGSKLQAWCNSKESKLMYEWGGEDQTHEKYMLWCVKQ